ncbi:MAG: glycosyltransferase family 2 protein [Sphaerobacter sp.]|nr:glycosyltransferase family 2 protein [Sphaerobacter sp.]
MSSVTSVVIVTYNGWPLLRACLASLREQERQPDEIIVVDNGSRDETRARLPVEFPEVRLVASQRNLGFAAGNNLGIAWARGDVIVLLNNDTVAEPGCIAGLVAPLERDPAIGAVAATMVFAGARDVVASAGIEVFEDGLALDRGLGRPLASLGGPRPVFGASAGAAAYRRAALHDVGLFPESFFMYLEDVDLAWRLRLRGWEAVHAPDAIVRHRYSASSVEGSAWKRRLLARNRMWVIVRCVPTPLLRRGAWRVLQYELLASGYALAHRDWPALHGRWSGLVGLRERLRERQAIQSAAVVPPERLAAWLRPPLPPRELVHLRRVTAELAALGTCG